MSNYTKIYGTRYIARTGVRDRRSNNAEVSEQAATVSVSMLHCCIFLHNEYGDHYYYIYIYIYSQYGWITFIKKKCDNFNIIQSKPVCLSHSTVDIKEHNKEKSILYVLLNLSITYIKSLQYTPITLHITSSIIRSST